MKKFIVYFTVLVATVSTTAFSASSVVTCAKQSPAHSVALVELYTSEGCSSCPPADQWLSGLANEGFTSDKVVPLAFHVDYWDYIGWKDPYASPKFTDRQRQVVEAGRAMFAYTPQVLFNGIDFGDWRNGANFSQAVLTSQKSKTTS